MATTRHNSLQATIKPSLVVQMKPPFTNRQRLEKHDQPSVRHFFVQAATLKSRLSHVSSPARCHKHHTTICRRASNIRGCRGHPLFAPIMSSASAAGLGSDELICSVCLDLLNDPVTLGCGHSFCLECVNQYWACRGGTSTYICPNCREVFPQKPQLKKNVIIASMVTQMNLGVEEQEKRPICPDHGKLIQLYCKDDDSLMCFMCMTVKHQQHKVVAVEVAHAELKDSLTAQSAQVEESKKHLESNLLQLRQKHANREGSAGDGTAALERKRGELYELVDKTVEVMKKRLLERERLECVLFEKHILEVEQKLERVQETELSLKEALQEAQAVAFLQDHKDVQCRLDSVRDIQHTLPDVLDFSKEQHELDSLIQLNKTFLKEIHTLPLIKDGKASIPGISGLSPNSLRNLYGRTLTLDHNSAHPNLLLSKDLKMATKTSSVQPHPDHPLRFDFYTQVLTTESFSSGRHYWEVDISRTNRCEIGAVYDSISRKGYGSECSLGGNLVSWCVRKWDGKYAAWHNGKRVLLNLMASPSRLGLCLDYEAGELVCYGDDTGLLHTFKATFNQPLLPALSLGAGSASFCLLW